MCPVLRSLSVLLICFCLDTFLVESCPPQAMDIPGRGVFCAEDQTCVANHVCGGEKIAKQSALVSCPVGSECCDKDAKDVEDNKKCVGAAEKPTRGFLFDLPYYGLLSEKNFGFGKSIRLEGRVGMESKLLTVNLQRGQMVWPTPTIAFNLVVGGNNVKANAYVNGSWGEEKQLGRDSAFDTGKSFRLEIVRRANSYEVYVNGLIRGEFPHRMNPNIVDTVEVTGDIYVGKVVIETYKSTSTAQKSIYPNHGVEDPVAISTNLGAIKVGTSFTVTGFILPISERFIVNLRALKHNVLFLFHLNPRLGEITMDVNAHTPKSGASDPSFQKYVKLPLSLCRSTNFTIQIVVAEKDYLVAINRRDWFKFEHGHLYTSIVSIDIKGDVSDVKLRTSIVSKYPEFTPESEPKEPPFGAE